MRRKVQTYVLYIFVIEYINNYINCPKKESVKFHIHPLDEFPPGWKIPALNIETATILLMYHNPRIRHTVAFLNFLPKKRKKFQRPALYSPAQSQITKFLALVSDDASHQHSPRVLFCRNVIYTFCESDLFSRCRTFGNASHEKRLSFRAMPAGCIKQCRSNAGSLAKMLIYY